MYQKVMSDFRRDYFEEIEKRSLSQRQSNVLHVRNSLSQSHQDTHSELSTPRSYIESNRSSDYSASNDFH